jgi:beta-glucanase (GH16 family)
MQKFTLSIISCISAVLPLLYLRTPSVNAQSAAAQSPELIWSDDFDSSSPGSTWNVQSSSDWGSDAGQLQQYDSSAVTVSDGVLQITAIQNDDDGSFTSGRVDTQGRMEAQYGLFAARIRIEKSIDAGISPAFGTVAFDSDSGGMCFLLYGIVIFGYLSEEYLTRVSFMPITIK